MNLIIGFFLLVIGAAIGFACCAMLTQSKIADDRAITAHVYEHLMHQKCRECKEKGE